MRLIPKVLGDVLVVDRKLHSPTRLLDVTRQARNQAGAFYSGLSIEFQSNHSNHFEGPLRRISQAALSAAAVVDSPSYAGSSVEVRHGEKRRLVWL